MPTDQISKLDASVADVYGANQVLRERLSILEQQVQSRPSVEKAGTGADPELDLGFAQRIASLE